jgi:hypothetical protein
LLAGTFFPSLTPDIFKKATVVEPDDGPISAEAKKAVEDQGISTYAGRSVTDRCMNSFPARRYPWQNA